MSLDDVILKLLARFADERVEYVLIGGASGAD